MKFLKACRWHFLWMAVLVAVALFTHSEFPKLDALPRMGAVFVIVAAVIAGVNSGTPVLSANDSLDIAALPDIGASGAEIDQHNQDRADRVAVAENAGRALLIHVPLWAGIGTLMWGFGDLLAALIA